MTTPLEAQSPLPPDFDPIFARMRGYEVGNDNTPMTLLAGGAGITIMMAGVLSIVVCLLLWVVVGDSGLGFWGWLVVLLLPLIGYMIWLDKRTRGRFWADTQAGAGVDWTVGEPDDSTNGALNAILRPIETALIGPRMIVGGFQRMKKFDARQFDQFLTRCAILVRTLGAAGGSAPLAKLPLPGETPAVLDQVLDFLDNRNWIGHSSDGQRVWLSSRAKDDLTQWGLLAAE